MSTLEEIRLRKALKASMKRAGYPLQTTQTSTSVEKENIQTLFRPDVFDSRDGKKCNLDVARSHPPNVVQIVTSLPSLPSLLCNVGGLCSCLLLLRQIYLNMFCVLTLMSLVFEAPGGARVSVTRRLGRKINSTGKLALSLQLSDTIVSDDVEIKSSLLVLDIDLRSAEDVPLKRSLAKRLGRVVDVDQPFLPPHTGQCCKSCSL